MVLSIINLHHWFTDRLLVRIRYVHQDVQRLRTVLDRQLWRYDTASGGWRLVSGMPSFE